MLLLSEFINKLLLWILITLGGLNFDAVSVKGCLRSYCCQRSLAIMRNSVCLFLLPRSINIRTIDNLLCIIHGCLGVILLNNGLVLYNFTISQVLRFLFCQQDVRKLRLLFIQRFWYRHPLRLCNIIFWFWKSLDCISLIVDFVLHLFGILLYVLVAILNSLYQLLPSKTFTVTELYFQSWSQRMVVRKSFRLLLHSILEWGWLFAHRMTLQILGQFPLYSLRLLLCLETHAVPRSHSLIFRILFCLIIDESKYMLRWHHFAKLGVRLFVIWNCLFAFFVKI